MLISNTGKHILLRQAVPDDAEVFHNAYASDAFSRLFRANGEKQSVEELRQCLAERASIPAESLNYIEFAIVLTGQTIGVAVLADYSQLHRRAEYLIGIFSESKRHAPHAIEASLLVLDLAFNHYNLNKLYTFAYGYNEYSQNIMENFGFAREGLLKEHHYSIPDKCFVDLYQNGMTEQIFRTSEKLSLLSKKLLNRDITLPAKNFTINLDLEIDLKSTMASGAKNIAETPLSDSDRVFNYLESIYQKHIPMPRSDSISGSGYYYRHYPGTNAYIGTANEAVYYWLPSEGGQVRLLGSIAEWLHAAAKAGY